MGVGPHALGCSEDQKPLEKGPEWRGPVVPTISTRSWPPLAQRRHRPGSELRLVPPAQPRGAGCGSPPRQRAPVTVALGGRAPDALWLAHPDVAGGARAVASVTRVQGHRAQAGAVESHGGVLHLAGGAAVHLCKDTRPSPALQAPAWPPAALTRAPCSPCSLSRGQNRPPGAAQGFPSPPSPAPC